jgi:ADP-ribose pyrophosphatase
MSELVLRGVEKVYEGNPILKLEVHDVLLPNGVARKLEVIHHSGAAAVVPLDEGGDVILVHQLRYAANREMLWEIPAGKLDAGEAPEVCAARELEEETGFRARSLEPLLPIWPTPGFCDERIWLYLARGLEPGTLARDEDEIMNVHRIPFARALDMIARGEITDAKTICGLAAAALKLRAL